MLCIPPAARPGHRRPHRAALVRGRRSPGIACSAVALSLQLWGQRRIPPSRAALILLSEPVFAALAGYVDGERLGAIELVGAAVILGGIAITELGPGRARADADDAVAEAELEAHLH